MGALLLAFALENPVVTAVISVLSTAVVTLAAHAVTNLVAAALEYLE